MSLWILGFNLSFIEMKINDFYYLYCKFIYNLKNNISVEENIYVVNLLF